MKPKLVQISRSGPLRAVGNIPEPYMITIHLLGCVVVILHQGHKTRAFLLLRKVLLPVHPTASHVHGSSGVDKSVGFLSSLGSEGTSPALLPDLVPSKARLLIFWLVPHMQRLIWLCPWVQNCYTLSELLNPWALTISGRLLIGLW